MAPEVFEERYNLKADVWSVGCVAFQMAMGVPPWKSEGFSNPIALFHHLKNTTGLPDMNWSSNALIREPERKIFEDMLKRCFCRQAQERPTCQGLSNHTFFIESASSSEEDVSHYKGIFSICDESYSTFDAKTPGAKVLSAKKKVSTANFLSPPMPRKIGIMSAVNVSPLEKSPTIDCNNWPSWAQDELQKVSNSHLETIPPPSPFVDSLAYSAEESTVGNMNPFGRNSTESCPGTSKSLKGLDLIDDSDR
jgi:serine/threonine protein kinase